nr:hypothetical protein CFP56_44037 [Quercus suber]
MAIPAARIMEKYPKFLLARLEVFRRPWDSVVRPDQKFFVVPRRTVRKLQKRIRKPKICVNSFMSHSDNSSEIMSLQKKDGFLSDSSITSSCFRASRRNLVEELESSAAASRGKEEGSKFCDMAAITYSYRRESGE